MQPQGINIGSSTKGLTVLDEFMYGFPSEGLSVVSYKWWVSDNPEASNLSDKVEIDVGGGCGGKSDITVVDEDSSSGEAATRSSSHEDKTNVIPRPRGSQLLKSTRKRAVEEGREAHKLGVFRGRRGREIGEKEKALLLGIFRSSLPEKWLES